MKTTASTSPTPFTDLMLHPEKLEAALKAAKRENDAFEASRIFGRNAGHGTAAKASARNQQNQTSPK